MNWHRQAVLAVFFSAHGCAMLACAENADLVLRNGRIITLDQQQPVVQALAANGDRIVAIGGNDKVGRLVSEHTKTIDLEGRLAIPGFIEGHGHFTSLGHSKTILDLTGANNWSEIAEQVATAARDTPRGDWIVGRGWHQAKWNETPRPHVDGYPVHDALSRLTPNHPVLLTHASGHMCFANKLAMQRAGITQDTPNPPGGEIVKDEAGRPIGIFRETAQGLVRQAQAATRGQRSADERRRDLLAEIELAS